MFTAARILISITAAIVSLGTASSSVLSPFGTDSAAEIIVLHRVDPSWHRAISDDLDRFEQAGLGTVAAAVHVWSPSDKATRCHDHSGYFSVVEGSPRVDICIEFVDTGLGAELRHNLVLHELAHAWIYANTTIADQTAFTDLHGAESWNDPATYHPARGSEIAANTIMRLLHPAGHDADDVCGYSLLTGTRATIETIDPCAPASTATTTTTSTTTIPTSDATPAYTGPAQLPGGVLPTNLAR